MPSSAYAPTVPGVTEPASTSKRLPEVLRAVRLVDDEGAPLKPNDRAGDLARVARGWYEAWEWYYAETKQCLAMENGAQFGYWNLRERRWVSTPESRNPDVIRIAINLIKPAVDQAKAMLTAERPRFGATAATSEGSDLAAGDAANELTEYFWRAKGLGRKYEKTARSAFSTGTAFVLVEWDTSLGAPTVIGASVGEDGEPQARFGMSGDIRFTVTQREQVAFDPASRDEQEGVGLFIKRRMSRARLLALFPEKDDVVLSDSGDDDEDPTWGRGEEYVERYSPATGGSGDDSTYESDEVTVYTFYLRASPDRPQGGMFIFTSEGKSLYEGDNPVYPSYEELQAGELWPEINWPVIALYGDERDNSPVGRGRTLDAIPIQKAVNGAFSKAVQHAALIANAKPILPGRSDFEWTDIPGQVIRTRRGESARDFGYLTPPQMPDAYMAIVNTGRELIENSMGINASSSGTTPTADASGRLVQQLQQRDQTRIAPIKAGLDHKWAVIVTLGLRFFRRHAEHKRRLLIVGENKAQALKFFDRSSLAAGTDVMVYNNTSIPTDPNQKMLWLMNFGTVLAQAKDERQEDLYIELANMRDLKGHLDKRSPHRVKALRNNRMLLMGEIPIPSPWDNAMVHKATLEELLCSEEWQRKVEQEEMDPAGMGQSELAEVAGLLWEHWTEMTLGALEPEPMPGDAGGMPPAPGAPQGLAMSSPSSEMTPANGSMTPTG